MIIGLTGGIGCGKSLVAGMFRDLNVKILDSDVIVREACSPEKPAYLAILDYFGASILQKDKQIDRVKLRELAFSSQKNKLFLENLLHPMVKNEIEIEKKKIKKGEYLIVVIPLLIEANFQKDVDRVLVIDCTVAEQIKRVKSRDNISEVLIQSILNSQTSSRERLKYADDVITNDGSKAELKTKVLALHYFYQSLLDHG